MKWVCERVCAWWTGVPSRMYRDLEPRMVFGSSSSLSRIKRWLKMNECFQTAFATVRENGLNFGSGATSWLHGRFISSTVCLLSLSGDILPSVAWWELANEACIQAQRPQREAVRGWQRAALLCVCMPHWSLLVVQQMRVVKLATRELIDSCLGNAGIWCTNVKISFTFKTIWNTSHFDSDRCFLKALEMPWLVVNFRSCEESSSTTFLSETQENLVEKKEKSLAAITMPSQASANHVLSFGRRWIWLESRAVRQRRKNSCNLLGSSSCSARRLIEEWWVCKKERL